MNNYIKLSVLRDYEYIYKLHTYADCIFIVNVKHGITNYITHCESKELFRIIRPGF